MVSMSMEAFCGVESMPIASSKVRRVFIALWYFTFSSFANNWWLVVLFFVMLSQSEVRRWPKG
jgi:hypothetical protein